MHNVTVDTKLLSNVLLSGSWRIDAKLFTKKKNNVDFPLFSFQLYLDVKYDAAAPNF